MSRSTSCYELVQGRSCHFGKIICYFGVTLLLASVIVTLFSLPKNLIDSIHRSETNTTEFNCTCCPQSMSSFFCRIEPFPMQDVSARIITALFAQNHGHSHTTSDTQRYETCVVTLTLHGIHPCHDLPCASTSYRMPEGDSTTDFIGKIHWDL